MKKLSQHIPASNMKIIGYSLAVLSLGLAIAYGGMIYFSQKPLQKACTLEAQICPDGSAVGRSGPNCEFKKCPAISPTTIPTQ